MAEEEPPSTLPALLAHLVATRADHPAIVTRAETLTYRDLDARSATLARALLAAGAGKGERIGLLAPDGVLWITVFLAALRIGALVTCISTLATARELAHIVAHSDCRFLIGARRFLSHDYGRTLEAALPGLTECRAGAIRLINVPYLRAVWLDDASGLGWAQGLEALLAGATGCEESILRAAEHEVASSDDAVVIYTSGSTAQPKA
ncbi:MAG: AMP-binding protein, partial [Novosphingobium sp.]|nr:AMP-binding protein [Novosphingobium sp.]